MQSGQREFTKSLGFLITLGREFSTVLSNAKVKDVGDQDVYSVMAESLGKPLTLDKSDEMGQAQALGLASAFNVKNTVKHWPKQPGRIGELLPHHWISADYSLPSWEGQVQTEHPAKGESDKPQAQER